MRPPRGAVAPESRTFGDPGSESVTRVAETGVPDADYEAAAAIFDAKQLADRTIAIGLMNAYNRVAIGFLATPEAAVVEAA